VLQLALWNMKGTGSQHVYSFMCYADVVAEERHVKGMLVSASGGNYYCNNWHGKSFLYHLQSALDYGQCKKVVEENYTAVNLCN
jgi:hypothetical protein